MEPTLGRGAREGFDPHAIQIEAEPEMPVDGGFQDDGAGTNLHAQSLLEPTRSVDVVVDGVEDPRLDAP